MVNNDGAKNTAAAAAAVRPAPLVAAPVRQRLAAPLVLTNRNAHAVERDTEKHLRLLLEGGGKHKRGGAAATTGGRSGISKPQQQKECKHPQKATLESSTIRTASVGAGTFPRPFRSKTAAAVVENPFLRATTTKRAAPTTMEPPASLNHAEKQQQRTMKRKKLSPATTAMLLLSDNKTPIKVLPPPSTSAATTSLVVYPSTVHCCGREPPSVVAPVTPADSEPRTKASVVPADHKLVDGSLNHTTTSLTLAVSRKRIRTETDLDRFRSWNNAALSTMTTPETKHLIQTVKVTAEKLPEPKEFEREESALLNRRWESSSEPAEAAEPPPPTTTRSVAGAIASIAALAPIPVPVKDRPKHPANNNDNFVRLNLRNKAGACRGARNKKTKTKSKLLWEEKKKAAKNAAKTAPNTASSFGGPLTLDGIDPVDDLLDGVYNTTATIKTMNNHKATKQPTTTIPLCSGHQQPCKQLTVKKASTGNKGRKFYCCSLPRGEQCQFFAWLDDTKEAVQAALLRNQSYSGFVGRQVQSYMEAIKVMTVPELKDLCARHQLAKTGAKKQLLVRLSLWARNELIHSNSNSNSTDPDVTCVPAAPTTTTKSSSQNDTKQSSDRIETENSTRKPDGIQTRTVTKVAASCESNNPTMKRNGMETRAVAKGIPTLDKSANGVTEMNTDCIETQTVAKSAACDADDDEDDDESSPSDDSSASSGDELEFVGPAIDTHENGLLSAIKQRNRKSFSIERNDDLTLALEHYFGHTSFRDGQEWAIRRCLEHKRTLLVAPTGSGKSLCYALPAALMEGVCIVVSPLLALIQDQIRVLPPSIPVATLSGQMPKAKLSATLDDISRGRMKIVYVSPEKLASSSFRRLFLPRWNRETKQYERYFPDVSLLCVDEAHCLSQWAHNFRPAYLRFASMIELIRPKSVLALTATAGPRVVADVCRSLGIVDDSLGQDKHNNIADYLGGVRLAKSDRDNIEVTCEVLDTQEQRLDRLVKLLQRPKSNKQSGWEGSLSSGNVIVYVWRQKDAEAVGENIQASGVEGGVVVYHGGMDSEHRAKAQSRFIRGKVRICVATVAFGLGINKSDVEGVIHMYLSSSPEHYLQEIGRAGRDGRRALAVALILKEEVLVRHSLAHSDTIAMSQITALLQLIREKTANATSKLTHTPDQLSLGLPIMESTMSCGCKSETVETLVSLLESRAGKKLLRVDGFFYDVATIAPKRCSISKLGEKEDAIKAILNCSTCLEPPAGEKQEQPLEDEGRSWKRPTNQAREHGFGMYRFSVAECANCLGPNAEPRHVFASLRRLQQDGEIDFALETGDKGSALNLRLLPDGVPIFAGSGSQPGPVEDVAEELFGLFRSTASATATKVIAIDRVLNAVAALPDPDAGRGFGKSKTLALFQNLIRDYFDQDQNEDSNGCCDDDGDGERSGVFDALPPNRQLVRELEQVILHISEIERASPFPGRLKLSDRNNLDYTALTATKFLHGIVPQMADHGACRQHHLFGMFQRTRFSQLHQAVTTMLTGNASL